MHGEGNLLAHLVVIGYKVSYQQSLLVEYEFRVTDLFADFQDGMRLCRAIQLLQNDSSILLKMVTPSDCRKKRVTNCGIALKWLNNLGVSLFDEDGMEITEDDIATGDKELTVSLLWNMFVHLQLPLLVNKTILLEETVGIRGTPMELSSSATISSSPLELLLDWLKAVCAKYDHKIENFFSLVDGRAIWCLLDYYFCKEMSCSQSSKDSSRGRSGESIMSASDYTDTVHNFMLSQKLATLLGSFPEVLPTSELLEHSGAISDKSVMILVVFLSSQLAAKKAVDQLNFHKLLGCNCQSLVRRHSRVEKSFITSQLEMNQKQTHEHSIEVCVDAASNFKSVRAWWEDMAARNSDFIEPSMLSKGYQIGTRNVKNGEAKQECAAIVIQSKFRKSREHQKYVRVKNAILILQSLLRAWILAKKKLASQEIAAITVQGFAHAGREKQSEKVMQYVKFIVDRHNFIKLRRSALIIQKETRIWIDKSHKRVSIARDDTVSSCARITGAIVIQKHIRAWITRGRYRDVQKERALQLAATKVQSHIRSWLLRRRFLKLQQATSRIQQYYRCLRCLRVFQHLAATQSAAIHIQSRVRGWLARRETERRKYLLCVLQKYCRGWLTRKHFLCQKQAATKIQSAIRWLSCFKALHAKEVAAIEIQRFVRGHITRKGLLGASGSYTGSSISRECLWSSELQIVMSSVLKLQRWWKGTLLHRLRTNAAMVIQSRCRVWISKQRTSRKRHHVIMIQSHWRGYLARKESKAQLVDLRLRMQKSARNVDDRMRIINKLKVAVSELLSMKSMSNILHICQTLDRTTQHSQRCCEELVGAGAIAMLLKLMRSVSRSIPDQEVLKHSLSTLRNLARYPHLVETLIESTGSVDTIFMEFLKNKEEGYFIAAEVIRKMCLNSKGIDAVRRSPALLKRLDSLVEDMKRKKVSSEMRNPRGASADTRRDAEKRRLREAAELLKLVRSN
ncbi:Abnormal spindle-like microcephaly-associated protein homolog [Linum grandiflorum]